MFLHHVDNVEYNLKQNIYIHTESLLYLHDTEYKNNKNESVMKNNINNLSIKYTNKT